ncbi:hypothetical protein ACT4R9_09625 [Ornithobacterium rhinotracheale]|uniref:hypothetical protein n=1 Tax=Ornithobacterium rhinotracheale TaxID=28251 RepID=UPI003FA497D0
MSERIFVMTSPKFQGSIIFKYGLNGLLKELKVEANFPREWHLHLLRNVAISINAIPKMKSSFETIKLEEMPADLSFEKFWKTYGNFAGKKKRCEQLWNALNDTERTQCLNYISIYKIAKSRDGTALAYPETYINNRVWEI